MFKQSWTSCFMLAFYASCFKKLEEYLNNICILGAHVCYLFLFKPWPLKSYDGFSLLQDLVILAEGGQVDERGDIFKTVDPLPALRLLPSHIHNPDAVERKQGRVLNKSSSPCAKGWKRLQEESAEHTITRTSIRSFECQCQFCHLSVMVLMVKE